MDEQTTIMTGPEMLEKQAQDDTGYIKALVEEGNWFGGYPSRIAMEESKERAQDTEAKARKIRTDFEISYAGPFSARMDVGEETSSFYQSDQWTPRDKEDLINDGLPPRVSNMMKRQIDTFLGEVIAKETEWRASGVTPEADKKSDFVDHLLRATAQANNWQRTKYFIIRDALVPGVGVGSAMLDPANPKGMIKLERYRWQEFMWQLESAKDGSLAGCKYIERLYFADRQKLKWEFPLWADQIENMQGNMYAYQYPYLNTMIRPKVHRTVGSSVGDDSMTFDPYTSRLSRNVLFKREFYRRREVPRFRVVDSYTGSGNDFDSYDQALDFFYKMKKYYQIMLAPQMGIPEDQVRPAISSPQLVHPTVVDQEIWIGDTLVAVNPSDVDRIPYKFCIPEYVDGTITSYFEHGKDMQRMRNVAMSFIMKLAASSKGRYIVNDYLWPQNMTQEQIDNMLISDIQPIHISTNKAEDINKLVGYIAPPPQGQLMNNLIGFATDDLNYYFGGLNSVGSQESSGESGKAVMARQQAAAIATIPSMNEIENFDREIGEDVAYLWQFTDPNVQIMATNASGDPEFRSMASEGIISIKDLEFRVRIAQVIGSSTEREAEVARLGRIAEQGGEAVAGAIIPTMLKKMDMDYDDRMEITNTIQQNQQFDQDLQQRDQAMREYETKMKWELAKQDRILKAKALEIEEKKLTTPNVAISLKPESTPPSILAAFINSYNAEIAATPEEVLMDKAVDQKFRLSVLGAQQVQESKLMTPVERKMQALKVKSMTRALMNKNNTSAKDTAARGNKSL